jgi:hypothetical protein
VEEWERDMSVDFYHGDCLEHMRAMPTDSVDLVFCSPPYEAARKYNELGFNLSGEEFVSWAVERYVECLRVSRGLVAWVIAGRTKAYRWSSVPVLIMADLHRAGVNLRSPAFYRRDGIPGSGGKDWLKNTTEFIICATPPGRLPWSDPTALGHPPKFPPGGRPSNQSRDGRVNRPRDAERRPDGSRDVRTYRPPERANPGNLIDCGPGGGGHMGHPLAHENEAPFPLKLAEFFVRSFCPPDGVVLDPFGGSGTTAHAATLHGRRAALIDVRESQIELARRRIEDVREGMKNAE